MAEQTLFDELDGLGTAVTPLMFTGADLELWNSLIRELRGGRWANVPRVKLYETLKRRTSMTCSMSSFRWSLNRALSETPNGETAKTPKPTRGRSRPRT